MNTQPASTLWTVPVTPSCTLIDEGARAQADAVDVKRAAGTVGTSGGCAGCAKDVFTRRESPTAGSRILGGLASRLRFNRCSRLRGLDHVDLGKTNMDEFAVKRIVHRTPGYGPPSVTLDTDRIRVVPVAKIKRRQSPRFGAANSTDTSGS